MKRKNYLRVFAVLGITTILMCGNAMANTGKVQFTIGSRIMIVDGKEYPMDAAAFVQKSTGTTLVPLRYAVTALSGNEEDSDTDFVWDAGSKTATVMYSSGAYKTPYDNSNVRYASNQKIIQFTVGSNNMIINGKAVPMDNGAVAEVLDGRCYIPIRAVATAVGCSVSWNGNTKTVTFNQG